MSTRDGKLDTRTRCARNERNPRICFVGHPRASREDRRPLYECSSSARDDCVSCVCVSSLSVDRTHATQISSCSEMETQEPATAARLRRASGDCLLAERLARGAIGTLVVSMTGDTDPRVSCRAGYRGGKTLRARNLDCANWSEWKGAAHSTYPRVTTCDRGLVAKAFGDARDCASGSRAALPRDAQSPFELLRRHDGQPGAFRGSRPSARSPSHESVRHAMPSG